MVKRILLPIIHKGDNTKAHPFPCQIANQTLELIQATILWYICADRAAGRVLPFKHGIDSIKSDLLKAGMQLDDWNAGWDYLRKYLPLFENIILQNVLVLTRSHKVKFQELLCR
jgi:hypothetical protein